ncbi:YicC family protein [Terasakiispira papahanaumokuakeensis]|uniref:YicC family protein n=1 Tax=Terasakiispira papahanaumokuakeensis TaxID=197479 RepID=A0A1E2VD68_9GAMM|nr:YicC/YloC family endoribonuclease [Terasakiispira papahanaumokuakeensis]ODC04802.1 YicC family protein [Terasakiispira papahanaumokuakeensis]
MALSMTAFARQEAQQEWGTLSWEIRSVNQRYLEPHFRLPDTLRALEPTLRERLRQKLARGKVDISLRFTPADQQATLELNEPLLNQVIGTAEQLQQRLDVSAPLDIMRLLQWPGVMQSAQVDPDELRQTALSLFNDTLEELIEHRRREGNSLVAHIEQRLTQILDIVEQVGDYLPEALQRYRAQLKQKALDMAIELDDGRLEQEVLILAQKADVDEELDRLKTHVKEAQRALKSSGPCGRRLDFLMQEFNREANTLGSKALSTDITQAAVDLKVLIEQMREQIQNIE